jgi:diguanylate cyclase (GGDEF)-like protein/PAS domain S-box-containing protein
LFHESISLVCWNGVSKGHRTKGRPQVAKPEKRCTNRGLTEDRFQRLVADSPDAICVVQDGRLMYVNATALQWVGVETREQLLRHDLAEFVDADAVLAVCARIAKLTEIGCATEPLEVRVVRLDGLALRVEVVGVLTLWDGEPAYQLILRDVSARAGPRRPSRRFETILENLDEGIVLMGNDGSVKFFNAATRRILDLKLEHLASDFATWAAWLPMYDVEGVPVPTEQRPVARALRTGVPFSKQVYAMDLPNGQRRWLLLSGRLVSLDDSGNADLLVSFSDVTEHHQSVERLVYQANHDPLTGLPNRGYVLRRISAALAAADGASLRAVLFIDLDDLKGTNDTLGHEAGDALLRTAAARLRQAVGPTDVVGRHGGDEFVALIFEAATHDELNALVDRLRAALAERVTIADTSMTIRASVGLVEVARGDRRDAEEILRNADRAMYEAKRAGRRIRYSQRRHSRQT